MTFSAFCKEHFEDNVEQALQQLAVEMYSGKYTFSKNKTAHAKIVRSMDKKARNQFTEFLQDEIQKNPSRYKTAQKMAILCTCVDMSPEDVLQTKGNPFIRKTMLDLLYVLGIFVVFVVLAVMKVRLNIENRVYDFCTVFFLPGMLSVRAMSISSHILNIFRFRKLKKFVLATADEEQVDPLSLESETAMPTTEIEFDSSEAEEESSTFESDKKVITRSYLIKFLRGSQRNVRNGAIVLGSMATIIFALCATSPKYRLIAVALCIGCAVAASIIAVRAHNRLKRVNDMKFHIVVDRLVDKRMITDTEYIAGKYTFCFKNHGNYKINHQHSGLYAAGFTEEQLFGAVNRDDECYLVMLDDDNSIQMVLPVDSFEPDRDGFVMETDRFVPVRTESADVLIEKEAAADMETLTERQREAVNNTVQALRAARPKNRKLAICVGIGLGITLLGFLHGAFCLLGLVVEPFLFIIPMVSAMRATIKAKNALAKVNLSYSAYSEFHHAQNTIAVTMLGLLFGSCFIYLANFFLMLMQATK